METIKRYGNRKLYSTTLSKYVTLKYVLDLVRTNQSFTVIDNADKTDITKQTMMQSLGQMELSKGVIEAVIRGN